MPPLVYVVMPVHNREFSLERSVTSIINQTYTNWQLIIVDDNSTDDTHLIIHKLIATDARISTKTNTEYSHSAAGARLSGIDERTGKYIAFLDSDDEWPEYHLMEFVNYLEENPSIDVIFGDITRRDFKTKKTIVKSKFTQENGLPKAINTQWDGIHGKINDNQLIEKAISYRFNIGLHTALLRTQVFDKITLREIKTGEDFLFTLELITNKFRLAASKKIHLLYNIHDQNISNSNKSNDISQQEKNCIQESLIYKDLIPKYLPHTHSIRNASEIALAKLYVWHLGNSIYRQNGMRYKAISTILKGITLHPTHAPYWKTLLATCITK